MLKGTFPGKKRGYNWKQENPKWESLPVKAKHMVKVGNHSHTNMIPKLATVRRVQMQEQELNFKLRDQQFQTILYIYRLLYQNTMRTSNQNTTINKTHIQTT